MLERIVHLRDAVNWTLLKHRDKTELSITDAQYVAAKQLSTFLKPFQVITDHMQGDTYSTLGAVAFFIHSLQRDLSAPRPPAAWKLPATWITCHQVVQRVRTFIMSDMDRRWNPISQTMFYGSSARYTLQRAALVD
jgi:hypothetical protein